MSTAGPVRPASLVADQWGSGPIDACIQNIAIFAPPDNRGHLRCARGCDLNGGLNDSMGPAGIRVALGPLQGAQRRNLRIPDFIDFGSWKSTKAPGHLSGSRDPESPNTVTHLSSRCNTGL